MDQDTELSGMAFDRNHIASQRFTLKSYFIEWFRNIDFIAVCRTKLNAR
jgi:hypothetical protein